MRCKRKYIQISTQEVLFYGYFITMLLIKGLGYADGVIYRIGLLIALFFGVGKLILESYSKREWLLISVLFVLAVVNRLRTGMDSTWLVVSLILLMKNISVKKTMMVGAFLWPLLFLLQVISHLLGIRSFDFVIHNKFGLGYVIRWAMGYVHPNVLQISYNVAVFYLVYVFCKSVYTLKKAFVVSSIGAVYIFMYSLSITGMIMFMAFWLLLCIVMLCRKNLKFKRWGQLLIISLLPFEAAGSILLPVILKGKAFDFLEKLLTHRPSLTRYFFLTYGISFIGNNPQGLSSNYTLDCAYANLLFHGGIILFVLILVGYFFLIRSEFTSFMNDGKEQSAVELAITLACLVGAVSEPFAFNTSFKNISLIFLGRFWYGLNSGEKEYGGIKFSCALPSLIIHPLYFIESLYDNVVRAFRHFKRKIKEFWKISLTVGILISFIGFIWYWNNAGRVDVYYSCRVNTDAGEEQKDGFYLTLDETREIMKDSSARILSYRDDQTQMVLFDGMIGKIEFIRGAVSISLWLFIIGEIGTIIFLDCFKDIVRRKNVYGQS